MFSAIPPPHAKIKQTPSPLFNHSPYGSGNRKSLPAFPQKSFNKKKSSLRPPGDASKFIQYKQNPIQPELNSTMTTTETQLKYLTRPWPRRMADRVLTFCSRTGRPSNNGIQPNVELQYTQPKRKEEGKRACNYLNSGKTPRRRWFFLYDVLFFPGHHQESQAKVSASIRQYSDLQIILRYHYRIKIDKPIQLGNLE